MEIHLSFFMIVFFGVHKSSPEISQRQKRSWIIDGFTIDEGYKGQFPYTLGKIDIEKNLSLFKIHGQGVDVEPKGVLQINQNTGVITVHRPVDYERYKVLKLVFQAFNEEKGEIDTRLGIEIEITDSNDNPPKFDLTTYVISIKESTLQGTDVIVVKANDADATEDNRRFDLKIVSVTPKQQDMEFYLNHMRDTQTGIISFKGCVDHEKAEKYMIIVEAKDHGEEIQLSSSCTIIINIEDGNNHLPEITGQAGPGSVKEGEEHILVSRLQVTDKDTKGTAAWRVKYQIQEDADNNFIITTDPETNEGLLYVEKRLDYEESHLKSMTITVENEIPYHTCKVVSRKATGLWDIVTTGGTGMERSYTTQRVTVTVEDINEPPIFDEPKKQVTLTENTVATQYLGTLTAKDPDFGSSNTVVYIKGDDPANWITVDRVTGKVTTSKALDRESHFVKNNTYKATIYAVDNGKPPMTGTATLSIKIQDGNDNAPTLDVSTIVMCQSDGPSLVNIAVFDLDEEPYGGPFHFKLLGDVEDRWRVDPHQGYSANLVKEKAVHSGQFKLILEVSDLQQKAALHNLSVTVCSCSKASKPSCNSSKSSKVGRGAVGIIFFSILLLGGMLLLATLLSCKAENKMLPDEGSGQHLMSCNLETPGTDCQVGIVPSNQRHSLNVKHNQLISDVSTTMLKQSFNTTSTAAAAAAQAHSVHGISQNRLGNYSHQMISDQHQRKSFVDHEFSRGSFMRRSMGSSSAKRGGYLDGNSEYRRWMGWSNHSAEHIREILFRALNMTLYKLQAPGEELGDYGPHVYVEEGYMESSYELDAIPIPDTSFDPDLDLNFKFSTLACIVTAYCTKTSSVMEKPQTIKLS